MLKSLCMNKEPDNKFVYNAERQVASVYIDASTKLGIAQAVSMIQDSVTEQFGFIGFDGIVCRQKYGTLWAFTKTRVRFAKRPSWREQFDSASFPVKAGGMRTYLNTVFTAKDGSLLLTANQEACLLNIESRRPVPVASIGYPTDGFPSPAMDEPFEKFGAEFNKEDKAYSQTVHSQHIDMSHHTNNIEYIKFALNVFTENFLLEKEPLLLEAHYTGETHENDVLDIYRKDVDSFSFIKITEASDGRSVFEMKIQFS